jgi:hypothetical protein
VTGIIRREVIEADPALERLLHKLFGVNDLADVEGAQDRKVKLSPSSTVACPAHGLLLVPDACRSCRLLAGEVRP